MCNNKEDFVNVSLRIRPVISQDSTASSCLQVISTQPPVVIVLDRAQTYHFDNIFGDDVDQKSVFNDTVRPLVEYVKKGYNCTIFAYGQTGTGKTYTMGTNPYVQNSKDKGLIPRTLEEFFTCSHLDEDIETYISVSFIEIYNEKVFDLLRLNSKEPLPVKGFNVPGVCIESVFSSNDAKEILERGNKNRHTAETKQNSNSSRSHAIFTIVCNIKTRDSETTSKLNLVDLAGSESVKKTGNQGSTFTEGININKGLLSIGQVVKALATDASFVPYRQSIITSILQDSLNKNNFVSLIACVNSNPEDIVETIQTLNFASEVKKLKNHPELNEVLTQYKKANPSLFRGSTPFKRPHSTPFKTPALKKVKNSIVPSLNIVAETTLMAPFGAPVASINEPPSAVSSPKSLFSASISSVSSQSNFVQQSLSPVIKKYMSQMELNLMNRMESVIRDTIQRPRRSIPGGKENKDKSHSSHWAEIKKDISKLVQQEISMLTIKAPKATSSPLELPEEARVRRALNYNNSPNDTFDFKKPKTILKLKKRKTLSMSPIETTRRSARLSLKRNVNNENDILLNQSVNTSTRNKKIKKVDDYDENLTINGSIEWSGRSKKKDTSTPYQSSGDDFEISEIQKRTLKEKSVVSSLEKTKRQTVVNAPRQKSGRIQNLQTPAKSQILERRRSVRLQKIQTPSKNKNETVRKQKQNKASPHTNHMKNVLNIINNGSLQEIGKLHTVGSKTAEQILLFRKLKGGFKSVNDMSSIPGWGTKKYQRFVSSNFLEK